VIGIAPVADPMGEGLEVGELAHVPVLMLNVLSAWPLAVAALWASANSQLLSPRLPVSTKPMLQLAAWKKLMRALQKPPVGPAHTHVEQSRVSAIDL
jgi:hypothetical protein